MSRQLLLVAASGLAREVAESAGRAGWDVVGCLDDNPALRGTELMPRLPVLGALDLVTEHPDVSLLLCAGKGAVREDMAERLRACGVDHERYAVLVDPSVVVPPSCTVGAGSILLAGTILTAFVTVGRHVVCMPNVVLTHDDVIDDYATLCAGVVLGGGVTVGRAAYLGMSSAVRERICIGADAFVGMGGVVIRDVSAGVLMVGMPAREMNEAAQ